MESLERWRYVFYAKGIYNCGMTLGMALGHAAGIELFGQPMLALFGDLPGNAVYVYLFLALAFAYGLGYWWVGQDPTRNHGIVRMGIIGQLATFGFVVWYAVLGQVRLMGVLSAFVDLPFAILYLVFLRRYRALEAAGAVPRAG